MAARDVPCNLCGGNRVILRYPLQRAGIVSCVACGFSFVSPRAPSATLLHRVQHWATEDVMDEERLRIAFDEGVLRHYRRYVARLEQHRGTGGRRLLDVGCSTGAFLDVARGAGWRVEGLELGRASATYARDHLGLTVHEMSLYDYDPPPGSYDAVSALEVIEHLEDPGAALDRMSRWLRPGGLLLISTPNFDSLFRRLHGARWWVVNCEDEHIVFFSASTLREMMVRHGFAVVSEQIRGCDLLGVLGMFARRAHQPEPQRSRSYEDARRETERAKAALRRVGGLSAARAGVRLLESAFSARRSPLYGLGEQLVFLGVRR